MKTKIITLIALLLSASGMYAQEHKILIAYFSWSGNTQHVAEYIAATCVRLSFDGATFWALSGFSS